MKKILFIFDRNLSSLPPMLAVLDSLVDLYEITFIVRDKEEVIESLYKKNKIKFISYNKALHRNNKFFRGINRVRQFHFFKRYIPNLIKQENYDLVWITTAETAVLLGKPLEGVKYVFTIYELYDIVPVLLKKIKPFAQNAACVIVPELNRAYMLRFWLDLSVTPTVIPNKPVKIPNKPSEFPIQLKSVADKKIILYQGHIAKARNLDALCEAISNMPEYILILMGSSYDNYLSELISKYSNILQVGFLPPPSHLKITSHAYIGVVTYDYTDLNGVYCAPNKIWEYSGYSVPMIANEIPGLIYTVGDSGAGCCIDMGDSVKIKEAIIKIDTNYQNYSLASKRMYDSVDVKELILSVVKNCI